MRFPTAALLSATLLAPALFPAQAAKTKKDVDSTDSIRALVHPGSATRKAEAANRQTAIQFWQSVTQGQKGDTTPTLLSPDFVSHAPGLTGNGEPFIDALRAREQSWKLAESRSPLFALSTGSLVMIAEGTDAKNPQAGFHTVVLRIEDGKVKEFWVDGQ